MLMPHAHAVTPLSMQPATGMNLSRIAFVTLLLNLTMATPLPKFHGYKNSMTDNKRTSNLQSMQLSYRGESACLALLA